MIIHPGIPKSGTTFIQDCLSHVIADRFNPEYKSFRQDLTRDEYWNGPNGFSVGEDVISDETLIYAPLLSVFCERLKQTIPDAHIVLTLRDQKELLKSLYMGSGHRLLSVPERYQGLPITFAEWFDWKQSDGVLWRMLDYSGLHDIFAQHFPVTLLFYEDMVVDKDAYKDQWASLLGRDDFSFDRPPKNQANAHRRRAYNGFRSKVLRGVPLSKMAPRGAKEALERFLDRGGSKPPELTPDQEAVLQTRLGASNARLEKITGRSLTYPQN